MYVFMDLRSRRDDGNVGAYVKGPSHLPSKVTSLPVPAAAARSAHPNIFFSFLGVSVVNKHSRNGRFDRAYVRT